MSFRHYAIIIGAFDSNLIIALYRLIDLAVQTTFRDTISYGIIMEADADIFSRRKEK